MSKRLREIVEVMSVKFMKKPLFVVEKKSTEKRILPEPYSVLW